MRHVAFDVCWLQNLLVIDGDRQVLASNFDPDSVEHTMWIQLFTESLIC